MWAVRFLLLGLAWFAVVLASADGDGPIDKSAFFDEQFQLIDKDNYGSSGAQRNAYGVFIVFIDDCEPCGKLLAVAQNASHIISGPLRTGASMYAINASNKDTAIVEGELGAEISKIVTFPAIFVTHFGRVNTNTRRIPNSDPQALANFIFTMSKPGSSEISTAKQYKEVLEGSRFQITIVVGYYTDGQSVYRLSELSEGFRGLVNFYHLTPRLVEEIQREAALPESVYGPIRKNNFVVFKQRGRGGVDHFTEFADRLKRREQKESRPTFNPLLADQAFDKPKKQPGVNRLETLKPEDIKRGGATSWYLTPVVDYNTVHRDDGCLAPDACMLHMRNRTEVKQFLSVIVFPPVDVLTIHNRDHFNVRTPNLVIFFSRAVSLAEADAQMHLSGRHVHTLHDERALLLQEASSQVKYMTTRFEQLSDKFPSFTFLFAGYEDNSQIFGQFGFELHDYEEGATHLIGAACGDRKYVYPGNIFTPTVMEEWLTNVLQGQAEGFEKSGIAPEDDPQPGVGTPIGEVVFHTIHRVTNSRLYDSVVFFAHEPKSSEYAVRHYAKLAEAEAENKHLNVLFFDALDNDPPLGFEFEVLPAIFFARFNETTAKNKIESYKGDFTQRSVTEWLRPLVNWPLLSKEEEEEKHYPPSDEEEQKKVKQAGPPKKYAGEARGSKTFHMRDGKPVPEEDL